MENVIRTIEVNGHKIKITIGYAGTMFGIYVNDICFGGNLYLPLAIQKAEAIAKNW